MSGAGGRLSILFTLLVFAQNNYVSQGQPPALDVAAGPYRPNQLRVKNNDKLTQPLEGEVLVRAENQIAVLEEQLKSLKKAVLKSKTTKALKAAAALDEMQPLPANGPKDGHPDSQYYQEGGNYQDGPEIDFVDPQEDGAPVKRPLRPKSARPATIRDRLFRLRQQVRNKVLANNKQIAPPLRRCPANRFPLNRGWNDVRGNSPQAGFNDDSGSVPSYDEPEVPPGNDDPLPHQRPRNRPNVPCGHSGESNFDEQPTGRRGRPLIRPSLNGPRKPIRPAQPKEYPEDYAYDGAGIRREAHEDSGPGDGVPVRKEADDLPVKNHGPQDDYPTDTIARRAADIGKEKLIDPKPGESQHAKKNADSIRPDLENVDHQELQAKTRFKYTLRPKGPQVEYRHKYVEDYREKGQNPHDDNSVMEVNYDEWESGKERKSVVVKNTGGGDGIKQHVLKMKALGDMLTGNFKPAGQSSGAKQRSSKK